MPGFRMPHQFLSFGAGDGLYGGSAFVWVNYESPFEWNAANVTGCFLVFARSAPVLIVTLQLSLKEFLTRELLRSSRSARHFSVANWDRPSDSSQVLWGMCCNFVVEPKVGVNDQHFSSSPRTDRE